MSDENHRRSEKTVEHLSSALKDIGQVANDLCEKALEDAKRQLHPLLQNAGLNRLSQRGDFLQAFKDALEEQVARKLAFWQPGVQAIFRYDETRTDDVVTWDGSIHLLVKVPRLSDKVRIVGKMLDRSLVICLRQLGWQRFSARQTVLEVQQVTPNELRHGVSYGAMFCAVYNTPVKVWPQTGKAS